MDKLLTIIKATEENLLNFLKAIYNLEDILYDFESACMCWMAEIDVIENSKKSIDIDETLFYLINHLSFLVMMVILTLLLLMV